MSGTTPPAAASAAAGAPDDTISVVVTAHAVYLPGGTQPFRQGATITGKRSAFAWLLAEGHVQLPA